MGKRIKKEDGKIKSYVLTIYLFLMFFIYPLYIDDGYYNIGSTKNKFFLYVSIAVVVIMLLIEGIEFIHKIVNNKVKKKFKIEWNRISVTEWMLFSYFIIVLLSYIFSDYKEITFWGATGWNMGCVPLLTLCILSYFISRMWNGDKKIMYGTMAVSAIVFLLGICNRFSFYPVSIEPIRPNFISTLGNINWFCGYMSVIAPIGISLFVLGNNAEYKNVWMKGLSFLYVIITFMACFCQGSSGVFLWNGALFVFLLWIAIRKREWTQNYLMMVFLWGISGQLVRLLKYLLPEGYNYDSAVLIDTNLTLIIALVAGIIYLILFMGKKESKEFKEEVIKVMHIILVVALIGSILLWVMISVYNTQFGIEGLMDNSFFLLDENWGNDRGASINASLILFGKMSLFQKLIGIGPDGFSGLAYSIPEIEDYLVSFFGNNILTNAHCELLTNLINIGILGTVAYVGIFVTFVLKCMKKGKEQPLLYVPAACVVCYFANNLFSFAQVLNIPFLFLLLGIGERFLREKERYKK